MRLVRARKHQGTFVDKKESPVDCDEWSRWKNDEDLACFCTSRLLILVNPNNGPSAGMQTGGFLFVELYSTTSVESLNRSN